MPSVSGGSSTSSFSTKGCCDGTGALLKQTGLSPEALNVAIEELARGLMVMCPPGTHDVAKCPPWTNVPTRHAVEVGGRHVCHAGCSLEAMNIAWCYPGEVVTIRSSCPETGTEIVIRLRGNEQVEVTPATTVGHTGVDPARWDDNWFHGCANNNFFASPRSRLGLGEAAPRAPGHHVDHGSAQGFRRLHQPARHGRPADPNDPRDAKSLFGRLNVAIPPHWTRLETN